MKLRPVVEVSCVISQGGQPKVSVLPLGEMLKAAKSIGKVAQTITSGAPADLVVGDSQCSYCDAKPICPSFIGTALADVCKGCPKEVDVDTLLQIYFALPVLEKMSKAVKDHVEQLFADGVIGEANGVKQVVSRAGGLAWKDEAQAAEVLNGRFRIKRDDLYGKLITPAEARKLLGLTRTATSEAFDALVESKPDSLTIVSLDDPRPAVVNATNDLEDLDGSDDIF